MLASRVVAADSICWLGIWEFVGGWGDGGVREAPRCCAASFDDGGCD